MQWELCNSLVITVKLGLTVWFSTQHEVWRGWFCRNGLLPGHQLLYYTAVYKDINDLLQTQVTCAFLPKTSVLTNEQYGFAKRHFWVHLDQTELNWLSWQSLPWPVEPSCRAWWLFSPLLEKKLCFFSWSCCGLLSVNRIDIFKRKVYSCLDSRIQSLNIKKTSHTISFDLLNKCRADFLCMHNNLPLPVQMRGLRTEAIQNISPWSQWYLANVNLLLPLCSCQLAYCAQQKRSKVAVPLHTHICASPFQHYVHLLYCLWNTCK